MKIKSNYDIIKFNFEKTSAGKEIVFVRKAAYLCVGAVTMLVIGVITGGKASAVERYEVMQYGDKDDYVYRLQEELHARNYLESEPTGYFGLETKKALSRYQERHDLESDGKAGPATQKEIYGSNYQAISSSREINNNKTDSDKTEDGKTKKSSTDTKDPSSLRLGDEGKSIRDIQRQLKKLGYYTYSKKTSYFGSITEEAVTEFQAQNGLKADGVVGKRTKRLLFSDDAKKYRKSKDSGSSRKKSTGASKNSKKSSSGSSKKDNFLEVARNQKGKKYRTGGTGPNTFDCSGFVYYCLKAQGISTPRTSSEMSRYSAWEKISSKSDLKRGDLVFFSSPGRTSGVGHVGIYLGDGRFIHSSSGKAYSVTTSSLSGSYATRYQFGRRIF